MYRSGKKDILNHEGTKFGNSVLDEEQNISKNLLNVRRIHLMANYPDHGPYMYTGHQSISHICQERYGWQSTKIGNWDHQICNMIRERMPDRNIVGMSQSQSFTNSPLVRQSLSYRDSTRSAAISHTSRLNQYAYMSPPSPHWATVGNIMTVKRSTSMPGSRPNSVTLPNSESREDNQSLMKKKCGPFQCLKYQFRRSGHKDVPVNNINQTKTNMNPSLEAGKISKSMFKKKTVTTSNCGQSSLNKPRGIRKSISLLFSKSNRSSKSDPSIIDQKEKSKNPSKISLQHTSRRNRSYESMLESGETKLSSDTNKYCSYSDVQDSSSLNKTKIAGSVDLMMDRRSPSEMSLSDSDSVCSSENQLSSQTAICYGSNSYRTSDSGWKVVVGNVCRSNSKDSAIANSTLSGDGMAGQSKRISISSTISRISDLTTTSDEFNDSSYSSFNDLQTNFSQFSYSKPRIRNTISNLKPINVDYNSAELPTSSDISPSSDSSTETLKPFRCHLSNKRSWSSHSQIINNIPNYFPLYKKDLKKKQCLKRSHSWPGCYPHLDSTQITFKSHPIIKPPFQPKPYVSIPNSGNFPRLKMGLHFQQNRLNSSPLLSQYSRLYSLRSSLIKDPHSLYCLSRQLSESTQAPISPMRQSHVPGSVFLKQQHS